MRDRQVARQRYGFVNCRGWLSKSGVRKAGAGGGKTTGRLEPHGKVEARRPQFAVKKEDREGRESACWPSSCSGGGGSPPADEARPTQGNLPLTNIKANN